MLKKIKITAKVMKRVAELMKIYSKEESERICQEVAQNLLTNYSNIDMKNIDEILDKEFKKVLDK